MEGQVAIVTGGTRGIGLKIARFLAVRKVTVCISGRDKEQGHLAVKSLTNVDKNSSVVFHACDVTDEKQLNGLFRQTQERFGRLDIVINNAGFLNEGERSAMIATNFVAVIQGTDLGLKYMSRQNGGQGGTIVNISSIGGMVLSPVAPAYGATKAAVLMYTRSMGMTSLTAHGIRINCMCPGFTDTGFLNMTEDTLYGPPGTLATFQQIMQRTPLLAADIVASAVMTLLDDVTISGTAILCSRDHPYAIMALPKDLHDIEKLCA